MTVAVSGSVPWWTLYMMCCLFVFFSDFIFSLIQCYISNNYVVETIRNIKPPVIGHVDIQVNVGDMIGVRARPASQSAELHELLPGYHVSTSAFLQQPSSVLM